MSSIGSFKERVLYCDVITTNFNLKSRERVLYCGVLITSLNLKSKERVLYCGVITTNLNLSRERVLYCGVLMNLKAMMSLPNYIGYYRLDFEDYISSKM